MPLRKPLIIAGMALAILADETRAQDAGGIGRLYDAVADVSARPLPSVKALASMCDGDVVCAGEALASSLGPHARLERITHPSTDSIRGVETRPSVEVSGENGRRVIRLGRFGRKAVWELREALQGAHETVIIDLRANRGGDFDRMLRVAGIFCGSVENAVRLVGENIERWFSIPGEKELHGRRKLQVWIGEQTASSAEVLAALLKLHAGAKLSGEKTFGKNVLLREVAVAHEWRLLVPSGRLEIEGIVLEGGLTPDESL
ncbi:MAG: S41 family peptidase [Hyphomicrobiales bacterium]|nr:S41 family peptidase [Hyphomicrobiales bacterium]MCY4054052.1 S41 family peptidase [Hyphomicrobiales bacterium]